MSLIPWRSKQKQPGQREFSPLATLRSEIDRLFDAFLRDPWEALDWPLAGERTWGPPVDVAENEKELTVRAEIPGVDPKDLEVTLSGNQLVLSGEKKESSQEQGKDFYHCETRYGSFRRVISLPAEVDPQQVEAEYANGVVTLRLKKLHAAAPKRIQVKVK